MTVIGDESLPESGSESKRRSTTSSVSSTSDITAKSPAPSEHRVPQSIMDSDYKYQFSESTITGSLHFQNAGALDWSVNGFLAYGCQNRIVVVDTNNTMKYSQTLHRHKHIVSLVRWAPGTNFILASVDISGVIIIWNVLESQALSVIASSNETKQVNWLHWITVERKISLSEDTIRSPCLVDLGAQSQKQLMQQKHHRSTLFVLTFCRLINSFILYDSETGNALARWTPDYKITHAEFNPFFSFNRSCDSSVFNLLIVFKSSTQSTEERVHIGVARIHKSDFYSENEPHKEMKKLNLAFECYVMQNSAYESGFLSSRSANSRPSRYDVITRLDKDKFKQSLVAHEPSNHSSNQATSTLIDHSGLLQIEFNKSMRNQIFVVFPRDIYLIDLLIETVIAVIPIERNCSKIQRIFSCSLRNSFYVFHETGNVSFRLYQKKVILDRSSLSPSTPEVPANDNNVLAADGNLKNASFLNVSYINLCQSEQIRLTKQNKILGSSMSFDESKVSFLLSSGRILIKSLVCQKIDRDSKSVPMLSDIVNQTLAMPVLSDLIKPQEYQLGAFLLAPGDSSSSSASASIVYKILVTQCINGLGAAPTAIRMCPPLTYFNLNAHKPYLAIGDALGSIQIWLLRNNTASLHREFSVHSYSVGGIEWTGLTSLISFSYPTISSPSHRDSTSSFSLSGIVAGSGSSSGRVTNELVHIDITTGKVTPFRTNRGNDSSPIETVRVSCQKQYMIILFKHGEPFEIWDVKTLTLLKVMSSQMANVSAVEWSPIRNFVNRQKSEGDDGEEKVQKENFIVTNRNLFHCSIEGTQLKELSCFPPDADNSHVNVTSIAWKNDHVLIGDASGTLNLWHLKNKSCKTDSSLRGSVKKIRFAPGKGIYRCLVLYHDYGVDIWDISEFRIHAQLKYPRDSNFKIIDIDWAGSEYPVLATSDGFIFVTNTKLKTYSSPIQYPHYDGRKFQSFAEKIVNKNGLTPDSMFNLKLNVNVNFLTLDSRKELIRNFLFSFPKDGEEFDLKQYLHSQTIMSRIFSNQCDSDFWSILSSILYGEELDSRLDLFLDSKQYRQLQQELLMLLESNRRTYEHAHTAYQMNLRLRNFRRAVQILLDTDVFQQNTNSDMFYLNALKACLITALQGDSQSQSSSGIPSQARPLSATGSVLSRSGVFTEGDALSDFEISVDEPETEGKEITRLDAVAPVVKLVATSLIASGSTLQGVELLNFISKNADSCRYLQSADKWLESVWLAKSSLDQHDCTEVLRRWCDTLISSELDSDEQIAFKVYLSRRHFSRVLRGLNRTHDLKGFQFAVCCVAGQLIDLETNHDILEEIFDRFVRNFYGLDSDTIAAIKKDVKSSEDSGDNQDNAEEADNDTDKDDADNETEKKIENPELEKHIKILRQFWRFFTVTK